MGPLAKLAGRNRRNMVLASPRARRALGISVLGVPRGNRIPGAAEGAADMYLPGKRTIVLQPWEVRAFRHPRRVSHEALSLAVYNLAHEFEHFRQERAGLPFNERQADRWGQQHMAWLARRMGIQRPVRL